MEAIFHILGTCGDTHTHIDLIDVIVMIGGGGAGALTIKMYYKTLVFVVKEFISNLFKS